MAGSSSTSAPFSAKLSCHLGNQLFGPCHQDFLSCQRLFFKPGKGICQGTHLSHHNDGRCLHTLALHLCFQCANRGYNPLLSCCGAFLQNGCRHLCFHSCTHKSLADIRQGADTHQKDQSSFGLHQGLKVNVVGFSLALVAGNDVNRRTEIPVGNRNSIVCRHCNG